MSYEENNILVCVKKDTELVYLNPTVGFYCNWLPINIKSSNIQSNISINISIDRSAINITSQNTISRIQVFDLFGREIYMEDCNNNSINLQSFSFPDFIILKIFLMDNSIVTKKIIIK